MRSKKKLWIRTAALCFVALFAAVAGIKGVQQTQFAFTPNFTALPTVVLDPGHGGIDGGAQANGVTEKDVNLAIALNLRDLLSAQGFRVIMTREDDRSIHDPGITQIARQKRSDLHNRLQILEDQPDAILVSIHQNKFEQSSSQGAQVFFGPNNPTSEVLAQSIQQAFVELLQPQNERQIKRAENNLFLLYEAKAPAVMVECGFLSNPEEAALLSQEPYQKQVAFAVMTGILQAVAASD